jgi:hypothetical protein
MDIDADVALLREERLARVQAHAHTNGTQAERRSSFPGRGECVRGLGKGNEERVALRVHFDTAVPGEGVAEYAPVLGKYRRIFIPELAQKPRRSLDVREEESDGASGQFGHTGMMRRRGVEV